MIVYNKIKLENFGAYRGKQTFELPEASNTAGISIVYALNGKGKTTLLNAFKFAFTGEVFDKKQEKFLELSQIFNKIEFENDKSTGKVELFFSHDNNEYVLTRNLDKSSKINQENFNLRKNGDFLNDDEKKSTISKIMPKQLVKFFLFDAAMLQDYSKLISDSERSIEIRNAIDDALGLPYFEKSLESFKLVKEFYLKEKTKLAKKSNKNTKILEEIEKLREKSAEHRSTLDDKENERSNNQIVIDDLKQKTLVKKDEKELIDKLTELLGTEAELKERMNQKKDSINLALDRQWMEPLREDINNKKDEIIEKSIKHNFQPELFDFLNSSIEKEECALCNASIKDERKAKLKKLRDSLKNSHEPLRQIKNILQSDTQVQDLIKLENDYNELLTNYNNIKSDISDFKKDGVTPNTNLTDLFEKYSAAVLNDNSLKNQIEEIKEQLRIDENAISKLSKNLITDEDDELLVFEDKITLVEYLIDVMETSHEYHRQSMKNSIENSASEWFSKATHLGYAGLKINNNYGMTLENKDGSTMDIKSDGTEHMVSLALIQALYKNSPVSGPLIIDSPMGQLDPKHKRKMLQELPSINNQIILLVHEGELTPLEAKDTFKGLLRKEYKIENVNDDPMHSVIGIM